MLDTFKNPWMLLLVGGFLLLGIGALAAKPLGLVRTRMTLAEYIEHDREGSSRAFIVDGQLGRSRRTGAHSARAGAYTVHFEGGLELTTEDGTTMSVLRLEDENGETGTFYFDASQITLPEQGSYVEVRGAFENITTFQQYGPPATISYGIVKSIQVLRPPPPT